MKKTTKRFKKIESLRDPQRLYGLEEAIVLVKKTATAGFDETLEISMGLNVDPRKSEQNVRGVVQMPSGTGKVVRVAVFARGDKEEQAKAAGADLVGSDDLVEQILSGNIHFDRCIATPDLMGLVGKVAKVLGPKGLMPNPKLGTVTLDVAAAVKAAKGGQVEYRCEKAGIVHAGIGKVSFSEKDLFENLKAFVSAVVRSRPATIKGSYIKRIALSSTMGLSVKVDVSQVYTHLV